MTTRPNPPLDIAAIREQLAGARGRDFWRGLEEISRTPEFEQLLEREFPQGASELSRGVDRRTFLKLLGASLGLAGLTGCGSPPKETIVPYVKQPEDIVPGRPQSYASALTLGGFATGVLVTAHMGRPTKVEGNPDHPASRGSTDAFMQASVLELYDPDRAQVVTSGGRIRSWAQFTDALAGALAAQAAVKGAGLRILTETLTSPSVVAGLAELVAAMPQARVHAWEPIGHENARAGAVLAFGQPLTVQPDFAKADVIVSLDADFLGAGTGQVAATRAFSSRRTVRAGSPAARMARLYVIEGSPSVTGANADHAWCLRSSAIGAVAAAIARAVGVDAAPVDLERSLGPSARKWVEGLAADLLTDGATSRARAAGSTLVVCGEAQPPAVHALVHAINEKLGNTGRTLELTRPVEAPAAPLDALVADMAKGEVNLLVILGGNPVYTAPADLGFAAALARVPFKVHLSSYHDETSALVDWHLPESHAFESWGDARAADGTATLVQPLTAPLYQTRTALEVVSALNGKAGATAYELVRNTWIQTYEGPDFESYWRRALHDGVIPGTAAAKVVASVRADAIQALRATVEPLAPGTFEVAFRPDPAVWDGRFANSGWLQELPKPLTRLTWDNAVLIAPGTAEALHLANEQVVELTLAGRTIRGPVWILPGHAADVVTVTLGYGRRAGGKLATGAGFDAYALRGARTLWGATGLKLAVKQATHPLSTTQLHWSIEGRDLLRVKTAQEWDRPAEHAHGAEHSPFPAGIEPNFYPPHPESPNQWAMSIDLSKCTGCNACVVACQSENNIPIVGKEEVARGRAMHWIRIDRYFDGPLDAPQTHHQPVLCMHCENAPCEVVCPVNATSHSEEGLNEQTYNRCVGTKYCSNNCPYKVRRFNFFQYSNVSSPTLKMLANPDVTVRARGVMEKCSYCVQRVDRARTDAKVEYSAGKRPDTMVRDGEAVSACQSACPAQAIVFGNIADPGSAISKLKKEPHDYGMLTELNTKPRTTYLTKVKNPNPRMEKSA